MIAPVSTSLSFLYILFPANPRSKRLNLSPKNCAPYSPPIMVSGAFRNGAMGDVVPHGSKVMRFPSLDSF
ncbi:hypothetical protein YC2023_004340 [Brassica napus]